MADELQYVSLLVASVIAFLMPYLARRLNIPVMVGEITLGIAVGFFGVGQLEPGLGQLRPQDDGTSERAGSRARVPGHVTGLAQPDPTLDQAWILLQRPLPRDDGPFEIAGE